MFGVSKYNLVSFFSGCIYNEVHHRGIVYIDCRKKAWESGVHDDGGAAVRVWRKLTFHTSRQYGKTAEPNL